MADAQDSKGTSFNSLDYEAILPGNVEECPHGECCVLEGRGFLLQLHTRTRALTMLRVPLAAMPAGRVEGK